jgi:hypothetical protein
MVAPFTEAQSVPLRIDKDDPRNRADISELLSRAVAVDWLAARISASNLDEDIFISLLSERCDGVLVYLHYVLTELRFGVRHPDEVADLPIGLDEYYAYQIRKWREHPSWDTVLLPLLATLGAAAESMTADALARLAGDISPAEVADLCNETIRTLLTAEAGRPQEADGKWGKPLVVPGLTHPGLVNSVSCAKPGWCAAGGSYSLQGKTQAIVADETVTPAG